MVKKQAVALYKSQAALAAALGITKQAVSMWPDDQPIPEKHALRLRYELKPKSFQRQRAA